MKYWHGGVRGLRVGQYVRPASETGAVGTLTEHGSRMRGGHVMRSDRVYVTTDRLAAVMYAAVHPSGGAVYQVEPEGTLTDDPDCDKPGLSYECERARIIDVANVSGYERRKVMRAVMA